MLSELVGLVREGVTQLTEMLLNAIQHVVECQRAARKCNYAGALECLVIVGEIALSIEGR